MGSSVITLLLISCGLLKWKNFESRSIYDKHVERVQCLVSCILFECPGKQQKTWRNVVRQGSTASLFSTPHMHLEKAKWVHNFEYITLLCHCCVTGLWMLQLMHDVVWVCNVHVLSVCHSRMWALWLLCAGTQEDFILLSCWCGTWHKNPSDWSVWSSYKVYSVCNVYIF